ncbi:hypothetical protein RJ641_032917 [Dillenia turbinata]|uniref:Uncharacterized protein n=1 Tax=Dillenia turbinata TaxID=194707 RepID=A0AAN8VU99_9MAGN
MRRGRKKATWTSVSSTRDINRLDLRLLLFLLWNSDGEHAILHASLHVIHLGILRKAEAAEELTTAALDAMPRVSLLLLLSALLSTDLENPSFFNLHLHFFLLESRKISLEDVSFGCFPPINASVDERGGLARRGRHGGESVGEEAIERIPYV